MFKNESLAVMAIVVSGAAFSQTVSDFEAMDVVLPSGDAYAAEFGEKISRGLPQVTAAIKGKKVYVGNLKDGEVKASVVRLVSRLGGSLAANSDAADTYVNSEFFKMYALSYAPQNIEEARKGEAPDFKAMRPMGCRVDGFNKYMPPYSQATFGKPMLPMMAGVQGAATQYSTSTGIVGAQSAGALAAQAGGSIGVVAVASLLGAIGAEALAPSKCNTGVSLMFAGSKNYSNYVFTGFYDAKNNGYVAVVRSVAKYDGFDGSYAIDYHARGIDSISKEGV